MAEPVPVSRSRVQMTQLVLPEHTNAIGTIFGGQVAAWIDICAAIAAQRFCRRQVVTVSIDSLRFLNPIQRGHIAIFQASVNAAWRTSMEIGVRVEGEDPMTGDRTHTASAYCTFVALDANGRPTMVPEALAESTVDQRRKDFAELRRSDRLLRSQRERQPR
jgi:acyl-CoA hydrolase